MFYYQIDDQLRLIIPLEQHAEELTKLVRANLGRLTPWMPWAVESYGISDARNYISANLSGFAIDGTFSASIVAGGRIVGQIGFHDYDRVNKYAYIGYWLAAEAEGKGIMTRCCRVLIDYLFRDFGLNRIQINCSVANVRSRAIPERLGFRLEGIQRKIENHHGEFRDWAVYAMLREEWDAERKPADQE